MGIKSSIQKKKKNRHAYIIGRYELIADKSVLRFITADK